MGIIRSHHILVVDAEGWTMGVSRRRSSWTFLPHDDKSVVAPYRRHQRVR